MKSCSKLNTNTEDEIIKEIKGRIEDKMGSANYTIMDAISEVIGETEEQ